jgi:hypothetical protein
VTTGLVAVTSGLTLYLFLSDTARRSEIRRRKQSLASKNLSVACLERARTRFGVLRVAGRFVNPFDEYVSFRGGVVDIDGGSRERGSGLCGKC